MVRATRIANAAGLSFVLLGLTRLAAGQCGDPGAGTCCLAHRGPACDDTDCCAKICATDPFCCAVAWDAICADQAATACAGCPPGPPPANDGCASALVAFDGPNAFTTVNATTDGPDHAGCATPTCGGDFGLHNDVWFEYVATTSGVLSVNTCRSADFDSKIAIYEGAGCSNLEARLVHCNDDGQVPCASDGAEALVLATQGTVYTIRIGSFVGETGTGTFSIEPGGSCPGEGDCCSANGTPGCADIDCCTLICSMDPFCCNVAWDQICADQANVQCDCLGKCGCGFLGGGDCCVGHGGFGCEDEACCSMVCEADPSCCDQWDGACADLARHYCPEICPPLDLGCGPGAGACCQHNGTPGCEEQACCQAVCAADPLCCSAAWDGYCAQQAVVLCGCASKKVGCGQIESGPCCVPHDSPYCADASCCEAVCAADPACCQSAWDDSCAEQAVALCSALPIDLPAAVLNTGRPTEGSGGLLVASPLGFPTVNGLGEPAVTGALTDGDRFVWFEGSIVWRNSDALPVVLTGAQFRMGISNDGSWAYVPFEDGLDALWVDGQHLVQEGEQVLGIGTLLGIQEVSMLDEPIVTWLASYGFASNPSQAIVMDLRPVVQTGDAFDGMAIGFNSIHMSHDFSGNGEHLIFEAAVGNNSGDEFVVVDGSVVAVEGFANGQGGVWLDFRDVGINDHGEFVFSGLSVSNPNFGPFIAVNGEIVDHLGVSSPPHVAINDCGDVVGLTGGPVATPTLRLLRRGSRGSYVATDLLAEGDMVRLSPVDCSATAVVLDFKTSDNNQPVLELSEDVLYVNATLQTSGKEVVEAVVRVPLPGRPGDLDGDGAVGIADLLILLGAWGACPPPPASCPGDLDGDGAAGIIDLLLLLASWKPC